MQEMSVDMDTRIAVSEGLASHILECARGCLASSRFFSGLSKGDIGPRHMRYVLAQNKLWRDSFHSWFALLIMKSGPCTQPARNQVIASLAEHVLSEMRDDHAGMYMQFLQDIGLTEPSLQQLEESMATRVYRRSFAQRFGIGESNFTDAVVALGARELFASVRNRSLQRSLTEWYHAPEEIRWLDLHESLEVDHFNETIGPLISSAAAEENPDRLLPLIRQEIQSAV